MTSREYKYWYIKHVFLKHKFCVKEFRDNIELFFPDWKKWSLDKKYKRALFNVAVYNSIEPSIKEEMDFFKNIFEGANT